MNEAGLDALPRYASAVRDAGHSLVIVHGGGRILSSVFEQLGVPVRKTLSLRTTTDQGMELATMVLCGLVNKQIVARLVADGQRAVGLCGADLGAMRSAFLNLDRLGRVGGPPRVNPEPLQWLLEADCAVVIAPVCSASDGGLVNVNSDTVAQTLAVALEAEVLEFVMDVDAVRGTHGPVDAMSAPDLETLVSGPAVSGGMVPKLQASLAALEGGVGRIRLGSFSSLASGGATEVTA
jgi:acetylglutamate kinase